MRFQDKPIHRLWGTSSLANIYKKDTPGQKPMKIAKKIIESLAEAKIGDKVQVTHGSQKGLVGHVGEIRKGIQKGDHTYTVDYEEGGKRQSVQVKKAHTKLIKEANDELNRKTPTEGEIMKKHNISKTEFDHQLAIGMKVEMEHTKNVMVAKQIAMDHLGEKPDYYSKLKKMVESHYKAPNASDKPDFGTYHVTVKHETGSKTYKLKNMKEPKHAMNTAQKIHRADNPEHKIKDVTYKKLEEENIAEISKQTAQSYLDKTTDPVHGIPASKEKLTKRLAGMSRAHARVTGKKPVSEAVSDEHPELKSIIDKYERYEGQGSFHKKPHQFSDDSRVYDRGQDLHQEYQAKKKELEKEHQKNEEIIYEVSKKLLANYVQKAATSMASAAFGQGQASASRRPPSERDEKTGMKRMTGIVRATHKMAKEETVQEQGLYLTVPDKKEKETVKRMQNKKKREAFIHHKDSEEHQTHLGIHEDKVVKPHEVSLQLKHPDLEGVVRKIVKINATSPLHAQKLVDAHYGKQGFKVHKVDYAKAHKVVPPKSDAEKQAEENKKEDDKIKKIAKAVKGAMK